MKRSNKDPIDDGIEIEWDESSGHLSLACEPGAFDRIRQVVREELRNFPEIDLNLAAELSISDTRKIVARRERPRNYLYSVLFVLLLVLPWGAGVGAIGALLFRWILN